MLLLALETSSSQGGLALFKGAEQLAFKEFPKGLVHGREITVYLDELMVNSGFSPSDLETIAVSAGPGSYTGIRVGVTVAKTLGYALNCGVMLVSSLEVLALNGWEASSQQKGDVPIEERLFCPVLDGKQGHLYRGVYRFSSGLKPERVVEDGVENVNELVDGFFPEIPPGTTLFGDGASIVRDRLSLGEDDPYDYGPSDWNLPRADRLGRLAVESISQGIHPAMGEEVHQLSPVYMRVSEAERKFAERRQEKGLKE